MAYSSDSDTDLVIDQFEYDVTRVKTKKSEELKARYSGKIDLSTSKLSSQITSAINERTRRIDQNRIREKDKSDRATTEMVLDARTLNNLYKMIHNETLKEINGCVSTGKEANVYHAFNAEGSEFAVKIFKTSILVFKDRDRYVSGEFRFRNGYGKGNPRKMVAVWAEKELRNLKRINVAGIPSPMPVLQKQNVLVMSFLGQDGVAAPRLKDCSFEDPDAIYKETMLLMRVMY
jgi:RIO kinase 1